MKNLLMAAFVAAFFIASQSANAQEHVGQRYFGVNIGQTKTDAYECDGGASVDWTNCPDKDTGIKLYVGHNLHKNFAVEAGFIDFGEFKSNFAFNDNGRIAHGLVKISGKSLFVAGMGKIHVHPKVTLFGKVGLHRWDIEAGIEGEFDSIDVDDDGVDWFYGIGGEVAPFTNERIKLRAEYEMFTAEDFNNSGSDFDFEFLSIGVTYAF